MSQRIGIFPRLTGETLTDWTLRYLSETTLVHNFPADGSVVAAETGRDSRAAGSRLDSAVPCHQREWRER